MSVLSVVQDVTARLGIPVPAAVVGNPDQQIQQLQGLLQQIGEELTVEYRWQTLRRSAQWASLAAESQGAITTRATPGGFKAIVNGTFWDLTLRRPVFGPISDEDWQMLKAFQPGGPVYQYRIAADLILINPVPPAGNQFSFIWETSWWVGNASGVPVGAAFTADSQQSLLPEDMMKIGLLAYWRRTKGLPYADDLETFNMMVDKYKMRDGTKQQLSLDQPSQRLVPGIFVPAGNWPT